MKGFKIWSSGIIVGLILCCSCNKINSLPQSTNFDVTNRVFRVNETPNGQVVNIIITEIKPNFSNNPYSYLKTTVNSNFNFGFTPIIGDSIKVLINSSASVSGYIGYKGVNFAPTTTNPTVNGGTYEEYDYLVVN